MIIDLKVDRRLSTKVKKKRYLVGVVEIAETQRLEIKLPKKRI